MKSTKRTRYIKFLHIKMRANPSPEFGALLDLTDALKKAREELHTGKLLQRKPPDAAREHVRIVDILVSKDERHATILFRQIDKDQPDAVYEGFDDGALEEHAKKPNQGNRATAHLTISLHDRKSIGDVQTFRGALEVVSGIGRNVIEQRLCSIGRLCARGVGTKDGGATSQPYFAVFEVVPFVERTVLQELQTGVLSGFTLVHSEAKIAGMDKTHLVRDEKRKLELGVVVSDWKTRLDDIYSTVVQRARADGYELIQTKYKNSDGNPVSVSISAQKDRKDAFESNSSQRRIESISAKTCIPSKRPSTPRSPTW